MDVSVPAKILSAPSSISTVPGESVVITIHFEGLPAPTPTWAVNSIPLVEDERHIIQHTATSVTLIIPSADVSDSATFTLTVKNETGQDDVSVDVTVKGVFI